MATEKDLINGNSSKIERDFINEGSKQDLKRQKLRDCGEAYIPRKRIAKSVISSPTEGQVCKCSHQCNKLTFDEKLVLFKSYHEKTYDEQSEYIFYNCMSLTEPKKRKANKAVSQKQATFLYQVQIGPKTVSICQKTLCNVLGITARRIQGLQIKMKNVKQTVDFSDKRGKHQNRPHNISEDLIRKIQDHFEIFFQHRSQYCEENVVEHLLGPELSFSEMYELFCKKHPEVKVSLRNYINIGSQDVDSLEDLDDPINYRLNSQNYVSIDSVNSEGKTVRDSLEADGQLCRIKAEMRTEVMKLLDGSSKSSRTKRPKSPHDVLLLNELIREYLDWIGYKYTSNILVAECELGKQPLDRAFLAQDLGVKETEKSQSMPLLFCLMETFKELKASSMSSC